MTAPQVTPYMKPPPEACACGCGVVGTPRTRKAKDGSYHVRKCSGFCCRGSRSRTLGRKGQARASNLLNMPKANTLRPGHEEHAGGPVRWEHKEGKTHAGPVLTKFLASEAQSAEARAVGDERPFVATFGHGKRVVAVFDLEDGPQVVAALAEAYGMTS